jgi:hypothetical protein
MNKMDRNIFFKTCIVIISLLFFVASASAITQQDIDSAFNDALTQRDAIVTELCTKAAAGDSAATDIIKAIASEVGDGSKSRPLPACAAEIADKAASGLSGINWPVVAGAIAVLAALIFGVLLRKDKKSGEDEEEKLLSQLTADEKRLYDIHKRKRARVEENTAEIYRLFGEGKSPQGAKARPEAKGQRQDKDALNARIGIKI